MSVLEGAIREELENSAPRLMAVLNPLKVTLTNFEAGKPKAAVPRSIRTTKKWAIAKYLFHKPSTSKPTTLPKIRLKASNA